jgi:hypothetical protein
MTKIFLALLFVLVILAGIYTFRADIGVLFVRDYKEAELTGKASPETYVKMVVVRDAEIRQVGEEIAKKCDYADKACVLYEIFMHVVTQYKYIPDPDDNNVISGFNITYRKKGGDCEDLSIFLASLLENMGIFTITAVQIDHVFVFACSVTREDLYRTIINRDKRFITLNFKPEHIALYEIDGFKCIPLDPSDKGEFPYPGSDVSGDTLFYVYPDYSEK